MVPDSGTEFGGVHPELVFGIQLHVGHRLELRFVEGRKLGFGCAEFLEMFVGVSESAVIGTVRAVALGQYVKFRGASPPASTLTVVMVVKAMGHNS